MARDAAARLYDVEKNRVELDADAGLITFHAKKGKSIDIRQLHESIRATRLSGRTGMELHTLEVTVVGRVSRDGSLIRVSGSGEEFALGEDPAATSKPAEKSAYQQLRDAVARGERVTSVTGRVHGWSGPFPRLLNTEVDSLGKEPGKPYLLVVTGFETGRR